ncbi:hypothetical protein AB4Y45_33250 [Paraburkholderia sp. EG287A]
MLRKHRKWPLGTAVLVKTPAGYLLGKVHKHWRITEVEHGATVEFPCVVDMGDANGSRTSHIIAFRNMKPVSKPAAYGRTGKDKAIKAPAGWRVLREFEVIPHVHREGYEDGTWGEPLTRHGNQTPMWASTAGAVRAYAVPRV